MAWTDNVAHTQNAQDSWQILFNAQDRSYDILDLPTWLRWEGLVTFTWLHTEYTEYNWIPDSLVPL